MRYFFGILLSILLFTNSWAACGDTYCSGSTCTATNLTAAVVQAAITEGLSCSGDVTVNLPSGTATWTSVGMTTNMTSVTASSIHIRGAGNTSTVITLSGSSFSFVGLLGKAWKFSDIGITGGAGTENQMISITGTSKTWRIYNCDFNVTVDTGRLIKTSGNTYGLIDTNTFRSSNDLYSEIVQVDHDNWTNWTRDMSFGTADAVYFENNTVTFDTRVEGRPAIDCENGGRYVFRFNTVTNDKTGAHGFDTGGGSSCMQIEVYNNTTTNNIGIPDSITYLSGKTRGGSVLYFNNSYDVAAERWVSAAGFCLEVYRVVNVTPYCDGTDYKWCSNLNADWTYTGGIAIGVDDAACSPYTAKWKMCSNNRMRLCQIDGDCESPGTCTEYVDGEAGTGVRPCWQGPGRGTNNMLVPVYGWANSFTGSAGWNLGDRNAPLLDCAGGGALVENTDYYNYTASFNGTVGVGVGLLSARPATCTTGVAYWATDQGSWNTSGSGGQGVLYKCTATNTWTSYYTPYTYPHPLRGETPSTPGITGVTITGGTIR